MNVREACVRQVNALVGILIDYLNKFYRAHSSMVERHSDKMEVEGSIPSVPTLSSLQFKVRQMA